MKIIVLGAGGMLGHQICSNLSELNAEVYASFRNSFSDYKNIPHFKEVKPIESLDVTDKNSLIAQLDKINPQVIINCVGVTTRKMNEQTDTIVHINSLLPHQLKTWCEQNNSFLYHFSTDCIFDGKSQTPYTESSPKTATDLYGLSKSLGEVADSKHALTIRSSIIGREIKHFTELVEWFLSQKKQQIKGFNNVMYSGVTTQTMSQIVKVLIQKDQPITGLYQVASKAISKYELLQILNKYFDNQCQIDKEPKPHCHKVLDGSLFSEKTGIYIPSWNEMILDMTKESYSFLNHANFKNVG